MLKWYFVTKIVVATCEKKMLREKLLKFEAEGQEVAKMLRSLEQFKHSYNKSSEEFLLRERPLILTNFR